MSFRTRRSQAFELTLVATALILEFSCARIHAPLRIGLGETVTRELIVTDGRGALSFEGASGRVLMVN
jgi:hypothetical protein